MYKELIKSARTIADSIHVHSSFQDWEAAEKDTLEKCADALEMAEKRIAELLLDCEMYQQKCMELNAQVDERRTGIKYVYLVAYASKENGALTLGYANIEIYAEIEYYEQLEQIAEKIAEGKNIDKGDKVIILNYELLRKQEGER